MNGPAFVPRSNMRIAAILLFVSPFLLRAQSHAQQELDLAKALYTSGANDSAMVHVDKAIDLDPSLAKAWKLRGDLRHRAKNTE